MKYQFTKNKAIVLAPTLIFLGFLVWWLYLRNFDLDSTRDSRQLWGATYQILALFGGIIGIFISKKWGGYRSFLGRAILAFSVGLFFQCFGQTYSSYYVFTNNVESPPYPGIGDIGFFGSVILYIYGVILLSRVSGLGDSMRKVQNKILALLIPILMIALSYSFFLRGYEFDWSQFLKIFLDFGYPLGQAIYVSIAILILLFSRNFLGGVMRNAILFLLLALVVQYISDFTFLYEAGLGTWYVGGVNDFMYSLSYFLMTLSLIYIGRTFNKIRST